MNNPFFHKLRYRLQSDFQLSVLCLICAAGTAGVIPFAIYRALQQQWVTCAIDITLSAALSSFAIFAWRTGKTARACQALALINTLLAIVYLHTLGMTGVFWLYPLFVSNFFLVERKHAWASVLTINLYMLFRPGFFPSPDQRFALIATSLLTCLLTHIFAQRTEQQRRQLENIASRDALTDIANRLNFNDELIRAHQSFEREQEGCGLLIIDIDHFKRFNDTWGHEAGDEVLIRLARFIEGSVRKTDRFFRYGGEEFVLLARPCTSASLATIAQKLCAQVADNISFNSQPIQISIGSALLRPDETPEQWFARADAALYRAKNGGRNQAINDD